MTARSVKSAERTLALFELFADRERPLSVSEVARGLNIPMPSASMLLRNLEELGYLDYDRDTRRFSPTIRITLLGGLITRRFAEVSALASRFETLTAILPGGRVFAMVQNNAAIQSVLMFEESTSGRLSVSARPGSLTCSSAGRAILSLMDDAEIIRWVRRSNAEALDPLLRVNERNLLEIVRQARRQGYAATEETAAPGRCGVAVALRPLVGERPIAIGFGGTKTQIIPNRDRLIGEALKFRATFEQSRLQLS